MGTEIQQNAGDEKDIITDQDETITHSIQTQEEGMGADGGDTPPLENSRAFEKGKRDVKDLIDRNIRSMNASTGRPPMQDISEDEPETSDDNEGFSFDSSEAPSKDEFANTTRGHETGAFTDIGEGRSSVTRQLKRNKPKHSIDKNY